MMILMHLSCRKIVLSYFSVRHPVTNRHSINCSTTYWCQSAFWFRSFLLHLCLLSGIDGLLILFVSVVVMFIFFLGISIIVATVRPFYVLLRTTASSFCHSATTTTIRYCWIRPMVLLFPFRLLLPFVFFFPPSSYSIIGHIIIGIIVIPTNLPTLLIAVDLYHKTNNRVYLLFWSCSDSVFGSDRIGSWNRYLIEF